MIERQPLRHQAAHGVPHDGRPLDAERVIVAAGLEPGKRVVVLGTELLDHVR